MASSATVRDTKQRIKSQLPNELKKGSAFELIISGSGERPDGKAVLSNLTRVPYRNVCFDLTRKPLSQIRFPRPLSRSEEVFRRQVQQSRFQAGIDRGWWRLVNIRWPHVVIAVSAAGRNGAEHFVRFRLDGYPAKPPSLEFWDERQQRTVPPNRWPAWFKCFVAEAYPDLITLDPAPYTADLLELSVLIATRRKRVCRETWNAVGDLTQCLAAMINQLLYRERLLGKDSNVRQHRRIRALVPHQQSA